MVDATYHCRTARCIRFSSDNSSITRTEVVCSQHKCLINIRGKEADEKHQENRKYYILVSLDLEKACDKETGREFWKCIREKGVSYEKYVFTGLYV